MRSHSGQASATVDRENLQEICSELARPLGENDFDGCKQFADSEAMLLGALGDGYARITAA